MTGNLSNFTFSKRNQRHESLRIDLRHGKLTANLKAFKYIDKDTQQVVISLPSLEITGYGETEAKAIDMLRFSLGDFSVYILSMPKDQIQIELAGLGWKKGIFNKEYSKCFVDENGELQNLNAVEDKIERLTLTAA